MSSAPLNDGPSQAETPDTSEFELSLASLIRLRGMALLEGLERHAPGLQEHAEATAAYAFAAAVELGFERGHAEAVREGAKLHDVGKVYVPAEVLAKQAADLGPREREQLDARHEAGYRLALGAGIPEQVCDWIRRSGERFDGRGPNGVRGDAIPIEARIARAACVCDGVLATPDDAPATADPAVRRRHALDRLRAAGGGELDPQVVEALASMLERRPG